MLSTPLICSSMGVAIDWATVWASAPRNVVWMRISGGTICGNWEMGNVNIDTAPMITMRMEITMATIGRLMKKRYMDQENSKLQVPNSKKAPNFKLQTHTPPSVWSLKFEVFLKF